MKTIFKQMTLALGTILIGTLLAASAHAECGILNLPKPAASLLPQSWQSQSEPASLLLVQDSTEPVVGMWHVTFIAKGNPNGPPDGTTVDNTLSHWHSDGTEMTLSSRPPASGDVCLGVWKKIGDRHYRLNHYGIGFDPATDPNTPLGFGNIRQDIVVSADGKTFQGTFSIRQYDSSGNLLVEIKGLLHGALVNINTTTGDLLSQS
jgi:hypothetical protein